MLKASFFLTAKATPPVGNTRRRAKRSLKHLQAGKPPQRRTPPMGATDVIPLVPISGITMKKCETGAKTWGKNRRKTENRFISTKNPQKKTEKFG